MVQRLDGSEEEGENVRAKLDRAVDVASWQTPLTRTHTPASRTVDIDGEEFVAPSWWRGDEEASQSFLASMGVVLE